MKRFFVSFLLIVIGVLLIGCSTTHQRSNVEYKQVVHFGRNGPAEPVLNELAKEGWRVVGYQRFTGAEDVFLLERKKTP